MKTLEQIAADSQHSASQLETAARESKINPVNITAGISWFDDAAAGEIKAAAERLFGQWIHAVPKTLEIGGA